MAENKVLKMATPKEEIPLSKESEIVCEKIKFYAECIYPGIRNAVLESFDIEDYGVWSFVNTRLDAISKSVDETINYLEEYLASKK